jgi:transcription antitermination factor NusG
MVEASSSALSCRRLAEIGPVADAPGDNSGKRWFAVFTVPRNEKSTARQLHLREIESFVPTYEVVRLWKNRQRVRVVQPLFPCYLFVRIGRPERSRVLASPGVLRIVGNSREPLPVPDATIEFLRSDFWANKLEPYREMIVGERVRIRSGAMEGLEGVLVRKNNNLRFVLSVDLINQHAAVEIDADRLEPVSR